MKKSNQIVTVVTALAVLASASLNANPANAWVRPGPGLGGVAGVGKPDIGPGQFQPGIGGIRPIRPGRPIIPGNPGRPGNDWPGHGGNIGGAHHNVMGGAIAAAAIGGLAVGAIAAAAASQGNCQIAIYNRRGQFIGYRHDDCDSDD